jgi:membrane-associated protease RseP (regulator of RpoE activity)
MQRHWIAVVVIAIVFGIALWWLGGTSSPTSQSAPMSAPPVAPALVPAPVAARRSMPPPAIQLAKPVVVHLAPAAAPGALEGTVLDAASDEGIASAELTFSHDDGAYSTATGAGGAFRFAPQAAGTYRLASIEAKGYAPFEREFGRSPVSFTSVPGKNVGGVVLRLSRERNNPPLGSFGKRHSGAEDGGVDAGDVPPAGGALFGRVSDASSGAPIAAFAVALWRRDGLGYTAAAAASFVDPSGAYEIDGLAPGTYEASAMAASYAPSSYAVVQIGDVRARADFALHSGARITGIVTDAATRRPIAGAALTLEGRRGDAPDLPVAPLSPEAETGGDGRFTLEHVPIDAVSLSVEKQGCLVRLVSLGELPQDGDAPPLAIALTPREAAADAHFDLTGIGAVLRAQADTLLIQQVYPNAGAAQAGLAPGDEIVAIDGARVTDLGFERAIGAIRGPEGSTVTLRIRRAGRELDVVVTRKLVRN